MRILLTLLFCLSLSMPSLAGTTYEVTASDADGNAVTYQVNFGGGKLFEQYTAYDPASGKFVYLSHRRGEKAPEPAATIWDHTTGKTIELYKFPDVEQPLPIIPSIREMAFCPKTGDKNYKSKPIIAYD